MKRETRINKEIENKKGKERKRKGKNKHTEEGGGVKDDLEWAGEKRKGKGKRKRAGRKERGRR